VVDVERAKLEVKTPLQARERVEKNDRVDAAAQTQEQGLPGRDGLLQARRDVRGEIDRGAATSLRLP
jgi:hypothetical protein